MLTSQLTSPERLRSYLLIAAGLALIVASLAWDLIRGADRLGFGRKQIAGCLVGAAMIAIGIWLGRARASGGLPISSSRRPSSQVLRWVAVKGDATL